MAEALDTEESRTYREEMGQDIRNQQAMKRAGRPEEQAATIAFLASDDASFITGQVINCSGGQSQYCVPQLPRQFGEGHWPRFAYLVEK